LWICPPPSFRESIWERRAREPVAVLLKRILWLSPSRSKSAAGEAAGSRRSSVTHTHAASAQGGKYPVVLVAPDGVACVSWKQAGELHWRPFSAEGRSLGDEASKPSPNASRHAGVVLKAGDFVLIG